MRSLLVLFVLVFSSAAFATAWNDLEVAQNYTLTQEIKLVSTGAGKPTLHIPAGTKLTISDILPLDMINVMLYKFNLSNCPGPSFVTEMEILPVTGTSPVVEIGAQIAENCQLEIFLETKDIYTTSIVK